MNLIQILLPLTDDTGHPFPHDFYDRLAQELTNKFGGVTSYARSPGEGRWKNSASTEHDDVVVIEVMVDKMERDWWSALGRRLAREFRQDTVVIRSQPMELL
jgi:hypothetical protein